MSNDTLTDVTREFRSSFRRVGKWQDSHNKDADILIVGDLVLTIDIVKLHRYLAPRALDSIKGKAQLLDGAIKMVAKDRTFTPMPDTARSDREA